LENSVASILNGQSEEQRCGEMMMRWHMGSEEPEQGVAVEHMVMRDALKRNSWRRRKVQ
jgi:hypothetical protein